MIRYSYTTDFIKRKFFIFGNRQGVFETIRVEFLVNNMDYWARSISDLPVIYPAIDQF